MNLRRTLKMLGLHEPEATASQPRRTAVARNDGHDQDRIDKANGKRHRRRLRNIEEAERRSYGERKR